MNEITLLIQETSFERSDNKEKVEGVTFIVDGHLKEILEQILEKKPGEYQNVTELMRDVVVRGLNDFYKELH